MTNAFRTTKTKKMEASPSSNIKLSEKDEHKRSLDARREKDFERMKEENERCFASTLHPLIAGKSCRFFFA